MRFEIGREKVDPHNCPRINDVDAIHHLWWIEKRSKWRHSDFSDRLLGEAGIVPSELAGRLQRMARFRNLLVHMYWKIDYGQVFDILHTNLEDLRAFSAATLRLL